MKVCELNEGGAMMLAKGIVEQAIDDLRSSFYGFRVEESRSPEYMIADCKKFFLGEDIKMYTDLNGRYIYYMTQIESIERVINEYETFLKDYKKADSTIRLEVKKKKSMGVDGMSYSIVPNMIKPIADALEEQIKVLKVAKENLFQEYMNGE